MMHPRPKSRKYKYEDLPRTREEMREIWKELCAKREPNKPFVIYRKKAFFTFGEFLGESKC